SVRENSLFVLARGKPSGSLLLCLDGPLISRRRKLLHPPGLCPLLSLVRALLGSEGVLVLLFEPGLLLREFVLLLSQEIQLTRLGEFLPLHSGSCPLFVERGFLKNRGRQFCRFGRDGRIFCGEHISFMGLSFFAQRFSVGEFARIFEGLLRGCVPRPGLLIILFLPQLIRPGLQGESTAIK